jgi:hypothetical protein
MKFIRRRWNMSQRKASREWSMIRTADDTELEVIQEYLLVGFISRFPFAKDPWWLRHDFRKVIGTMVEEEAVLSDPEALSALHLGDAPVPVQRVRMFLLPDSTGSPNLSRAIIEKIQEQGGPFPDGTVMWIDIASSDMFRAPWILEPSVVAYGIGRLPVRRAILGPSASLLMEFGREPDPGEWIFIGREFQPVSWEIRGRLILLTCKAKGRFPLTQNR